MSALQRMIPRDHITQYVTGTLSLAKHMMIDCQRDVSKRAASEIDSQDEIAASLILSEGSTQDVKLSANFMSRALSALPRTSTRTSTPTSNCPKPSNRNAKPERSISSAPAPVPANDLLPKTLEAFLGGKTIDWAFFAPGIKSKSLWRSPEGEHLWLIKIKGGKVMPEHSHVGEEWTLILQGSYHVGTTQYTRGDLKIEDENCTHMPIIDPGKDCICLVLTEGPMQPTGLVPRLLMAFTKGFNPQG